MDAAWNHVLRHFARAGLPARLVSPDRHRNRWRRMRERQVQKEVAIVADVELRKRREEFTLLPGINGEPTVLDWDARLRHLLLLVRKGSRERRLLFGHDERHLFVARLPHAPITRLREAFGVLKPEAARRAEARGVKVIRQGEWFFVSTPEFRAVGNVIVHRKVPLRPSHPFRRGGNEHIAEELARVRGEQSRIDVYARGTVRHVEHATIKLDGWHRVLRNTEPTDVVWPQAAEVGFVD